MAFLSTIAWIATVGGLFVGLLTVRIKKIYQLYTYLTVLY